MSCLLGAEVVVDLAERHVGRLGDATRRQGGVAVGEEARPGRVEDRAHGSRRWRDRGVPRGYPIVGPAAMCRSIRSPLQPLTTATAATTRMTPSGRVSRRPQGMFFSMAVSAAEREHERGAAEARRRTSRASATSNSRRRRRRGRCPSRRDSRPLGDAAPAVHDEPQRAPAFVEAAVADRAELPQAGDEEGRGQDQLRVRGEGRDRLDAGVDGPVEQPGAQPEGRSRRRDSRAGAARRADPGAVDGRRVPGTS